MKTKTKIGIIAVISVWVVSLILSFHTYGSLFLLMPPTILAISALTWMSDLNDSECVEGKKRTVADLYSRIPGAGHLYLGKRKRSVPFFLAIATSLFVLSLVSFYPSDAVYLIIIFMLTFLYASFISYIDIENLCDKMGLPQEGPVDEKYKSRHYEYVLITSIISLVVFGSFEKRMDLIF